jgi:hypothetical protein
MSQTPVSNSFFEKAYDPIIQASIVLGLGLVVMIGGKLIALMDVISVSDRFPWMTATSFLLFYAMFNSIFSLSSKDMNKYWGRSMLAYLGLIVCSGLLAYLFSSMSINNAGSYRWIMIVLTFGYLVFMSIVRFMKNIVEFAEKEEWNSPKKRQR